MERIMRFMVIVKASKDTEAGVMPNTEILAAMGRFNEEMAKAGVIKAGEGLHPTSRGARIKYAGNGQAAASNGPFSLSGDLIAYNKQNKTTTHKKTNNKKKRAPFGPGDEIDIRQVFT